MAERQRPGAVRDAILACLKSADEGATVADIQAAVGRTLGGTAKPSSVRSYLNINTPGLFERVGRGRYRLAR